MSLPDYEGKNYSDSDGDESDISPEQSPLEQLSPVDQQLPLIRNSDAILRSTSSTDGGELKTDVSEQSEGNIPTTEDVSVEHKSSGQGEAGHLRTPSASREVEGGALDELLDDYQYPSHSNTPEFAPAEFSAQDSPTKDTSTVKEEDPTMVVKNIRRTEAIASSASQAAIIPSPVSSTIDPTKTETISFVQDAMKTWDPPTLKDPASTQATSNSPPQPTARSVSPPQSAPGPPPQAQRNSIPSQSSRAIPTSATPSQNTPAPPQTPTDPYASSNYWAQMRANLKGKRTGSHEMSRTKTGGSTPPDDSSIQKSVSPAPTRSSNESSRSVTKPVPVTDGRSGSFTSYTPLPKFPETRPESSGMPYGKQPPSLPTIDTSTTGKPPFTEVTEQRRGSLSDVNRPILALSGTPPSGYRSASSSPVVGSLPFSNSQNVDRPSSRNRNRDGPVGKLPVFAPREGLPEIRVDERIERPQSPSRGMSPGQPPRPQSPARGISPARSIPPPSSEKGSRTHSPLKDLPVENKGMSLPTTNRTPSPLRTVPAIIPVHFPSQVEVASQYVAHPLVKPSPPPQPVTQTQVSQPLSPKPQKKVSLPTIPPITIPPPMHPGVDQKRSIYPDSKWTEKNTEESHGSPVNKRITVFLQEASKRKESLPPLPTNPPPPLPRSQSAAQPVSNGNTNDPVERWKEQYNNPSSPSTSPTAPVLESRIPVSERGGGLGEQSHLIAPDRIAPTATSHLISAPLSQSSDQQSRVRADEPSSVPEVPPVEQNDGEGSERQLPEVVSRPMTWGPLTFESPKKEEEAKGNPLEDIEEDSESDWEKIDESELQEEAAPVTEKEEAPSTPQNRHISYFSQDPVSLTLDPMPEITEAHVPPDSDSEEDTPVRLNKGKAPETYDDDPITNTEPMLDNAHTDPESTFRSKYIDRDITSFITPANVKMSPPNNRERHNLPQLRTQSASNPSSAPLISLEFLPSFLLSEDIPNMTSVAQRIGAYQTRRDQMIRTDTGLRGWLLQVQNIRPLPQRPPEIRPLSKESYGQPASPSTIPSPFAGSSKVGRKVISKMKIGGKIIGAATKSTIDKISTVTNEKRFSGDIHNIRQNSEGAKYSPSLQQQPSPKYRTSGVDSPVVGRSEGPLEEEFGQGALRDPETGGYISSARNQDESQSMDLGLPTSHQRFSYEIYPPASFGQIELPAAPPDSPLFHPPPSRRDERPQTPVSPGPVMSKKEGKPSSHGFSNSVSGGQISKLFSHTRSDSKLKHQSDSTEYPTGLSSPQQSPRQKSKFSKFVNDLSQSTLTGSKPNQQQSGVPTSPPPPPPPDKSQFRTSSEGGSGGGIRGFFADISSRDLTGNRPGERPTFSARLPGASTSPRSSKTSQRSPDERSTGGGFPGFLSDIGNRDLTGQTEQDRIAAARRREQEYTHIPAQPLVYDESSSDWEVKLGIMEDVLPHVRKELLVSSLKEAGGDEQRAIGLAVLKSR